MSHQDLAIKTAIQIARSPHDVFEAIADPAQMSNYFIAAGSGRIEEGRHLSWKFPEFDMEVPVRVGKVEQDRYLSYYWEGAKDHEGFVEMTLSAEGDGATVVRVTEKGMVNDEAGIRWLQLNTEGWANFLACLKAWLEYGINLRKGAFDYMKKPV